MAEKVQQLEEILVKVRGNDLEFKSMHEFRRRQMTVEQVLMIALPRDLRVLSEKKGWNEIPGYIQGMMIEDLAHLLILLVKWEEFQPLFLSALQKVDRKSWPLTDRLMVALGRRSVITEQYYYLSAALREKMKQEIRMEMMDYEAYSLLLPYQKECVKKLGIEVKPPVCSTESIVAPVFFDWEDQPLKVREESDKISDDLLTTNMRSSALLQGSELSDSFEQRKQEHWRLKCRVVGMALDRMNMGGEVYPKYVSAIQGQSFVNFAYENKQISPDQVKLSVGKQIDSLVGSTERESLLQQTVRLPELVEIINKRKSERPSEQDEIFAVRMIETAFRARFHEDHQGYDKVTAEVFVASLRGESRQNWLEKIGNKVNEIYSLPMHMEVVLPEIVPPPPVAFPDLRLQAEVVELVDVDGGKRKKGKKRRCSTEAKAEKKKIRREQRSYFLPRSSEFIELACCLFSVTPVDLQEILLRNYAQNENQYFSNPIVRHGIFRPQPSKGFSKEELESLLHSSVEQKNARDLTFGDFPIRLFYLTDKLVEIGTELDRTCTLFITFKVPGPYVVHLTMGTPSRLVHYGQEIEFRHLVQVGGTGTTVEWRSRKSLIPGPEWGDTLKLQPLKECPVDHPLWITVWGVDFCSARCVFPARAIDPQFHSYSDIAEYIDGKWVVLGERYKERVHPLNFSSLGGQGLIGPQK